MNIEQWIKQWQKDTFPDGDPKYVIQWSPDKSEIEKSIPILKKLYNARQTTMQQKFVVTLTLSQLFSWINYLHEEKKITKAERDELMKMMSDTLKAK